MTKILTSLLAVLFAFSCYAETSIEDLTQKAIKDIKLSAKATKADESELRKISPDFALTYRLFKSTAVIQFKEPDKVRIDGTLGKTKGMYITNGNKRLTSIPSLRIRQVEDISNAPGKRTSSLDFGFITSGFLNLANFKYIRDDKDGNIIFDVTWKNAEDSSRHRIWLDPDKKIIIKREWYNQEGRLMAIFKYSEAKKLASEVYVPTKMEIVNPEGKIAGETELSNFALNKNIEDSVFTW